MHKFIGLCAMTAAAVDARAPKWHQLDESYTYTQYLADFQKKPATSPAEHAAREAHFAAALKEILTHNSKTDVSYRMGVNHLTDLFPEETARMRGSRAVDMRSLTEITEYVPTGKPVPKEFDWRKQLPTVVGPVKNQGRCGDCWAHAAAETLESHWAIQKGQLWTLSTQQITSCAPNPDECGGTGGCAGSTAELAWAYLQNASVGVHSEFTYPFTSGVSAKTGVCMTSESQIGTPTEVKVTGVVKMKNNIEVSALMDIVANVGPVAVNVAADWKNYHSGVYDGCSYPQTIDHVVVVDGYGTDEATGKDYWLVRNSWSPAWGEHGYIRLPRDSTCGTVTNNADGVGCKGAPSNVTGCGACAILYDTSYPKV